ncbi:MAG: DUF2129 domain-containing protein [Hydrogenibacillus sp.]|nr:DUF2129 domain-containing protein [Hydrogenibacillus sp.]
MHGKVSLAVWLDHPRSARFLRRYGYVHYVSQRMKYAVVYVDRKQAPAIMRALLANHHIRRVEPSPYQEAVHAVVHHGSP